VTSENDRELLAQTRRLMRDLYDAYLQTPAWYKKRAIAFAIHGHRCDVCGTTKGPLQVHHRHYRTLGREDPRRDLQVLCRPCHCETHGIEEEARPPSPSKRRRKKRRPEPPVGRLDWLWEQNQKRK